MHDFYVFLPSCGTVKSVSLLTWFRFAYHPLFRCTEKRGKIFYPLCAAGGERVDEHSAVGVSNPRATQLVSPAQSG